MADSSQLLVRASRKPIAWRPRVAMYLFVATVSGEIIEMRSAILNASCIMASLSGNTSFKRPMRWASLASTWSPVSEYRREFL